MISPVYRDRIGRQGDRRHYFQRRGYQYSLVTQGSTVSVFFTSRNCYYIAMRHPHQRISSRYLPRRSFSGIGFRRIVSKPLAVYREVTSSSFRPQVISLPSPGCAYILENRILPYPSWFLPWIHQHLHWFFNHYHISLSLHEALIRWMW